MPVSDAFWKYIFSLFHEESLCVLTFYNQKLSLLVSIIICIDTVNHVLLSNGLACFQELEVHDILNKDQYQLLFDLIRVDVFPSKYDIT